MPRRAGSMAKGSSTGGRLDSPHHFVIRACATLRALPPAGAPLEPGTCARTRACTRARTHARTHARALICTRAAVPRAVGSRPAFHRCRTRARSRAQRGKTNTCGMCGWMHTNTSMSMNMRAPAHAHALVCAQKSALHTRMHRRCNRSMWRCSGMTRGWRSCEGLPSMTRALVCISRSLLSHTTMSLLRHARMRALA